MAHLAATARFGIRSPDAGYGIRIAAGREGKSGWGRFSWWIAGALLVLAPSAAFAAPPEKCTFQAKGLAMSFGVLDPSNAVTVTVPVAAATLNANRVGDCPGSKTMVIDADDGQNFVGSRRMRKGATSDYIPYSLTGLPWSQSGPGNGSYVNFTFSGTVAGTAYEGASAGSYSDTVIITVSP
jgi:spore coat protein U-like protein